MKPFSMLLKQKWLQIMQKNYIFSEIISKWIGQFLYYSVKHVLI